MSQAPRPSPPLAITEGETLHNGKAGGWTESAFEGAFFTYYPRLVGMLCRMLGDRAQAEELASDTLSRLAARRVPLDRYSSLSGWLYRTATRMGIDAIRAATRRRRYEQMSAAEGSKDTPLDELLQSERSQLVRAALAQLKPGQSRILLLRNHGLSYKEIAEALNTRPSSIGTLLARAEAAFERAYRRQGDPAIVSPPTAPQLTKESR